MPNNRVFRHHELIKRTCPKVSPATLLALVQIESNGDPAAHRPGSSFYGLLQMNTGYVRTANPTFQGKAADLLGDAELALRMFASIYDRTSNWHLHEPDLVAFGHKAGMGALKRYRHYHAHQTIDEALPEIIAHYAAKGVIIPRADVYLDRFRRAYEEWDEFLDTAAPLTEVLASAHYDDEQGVCWVAEEDAPA